MATIVVRNAEREDCSDPVKIWVTPYGERARELFGVLMQQTQSATTSLVFPNSQQHLEVIVRGETLKILHIKGRRYGVRVS